MGKVIARRSAKTVSGMQSSWQRSCDGLFLLCCLLSCWDGHIRLIRTYLESSKRNKDGSESQKLGLVCKGVGGVGIGRLESKCEIQ
jgi:hypothetical protein